MIDLNAVEKFADIDPQAMLAHATALPQTCADAWELASHTFPRLHLPSDYREVRQIVVAGMGGSAIGGDLLVALVTPECPIPIFVNRSYDLPTFVNGPDTLVIGASHSGNTEETLSAIEQAHARGASLLAITTGGELARLCSEWGAPVLRFAYNSQPRAALGYSFIPLLNLLCQLGLIEDKTAALNEAVHVMHDWQVEIGPTSPLSNNPAKRLAGQLVERMPVIYGAGLMAPVARRWKTQFNENSKAWAFFEELPELNHNAVVGYEMSERIREWATVVFVRSRYDSPRIQARWRITRELLIREGVGSDQVYARGQSRLAQMLSLIHFGDLVSVYLALATGIDPTPVTPIAYLKEQLTLVP
jgi:glucose/mannose-6-phosphate isomerase